MAEADLKGRWVASKVTDATISKLRAAGYLPADAACRAPEPNQRVPTPKPGERVVFIPHLVRGLGFPLHPFVRGILFFHGLDFHNVAPNSIMHLTTFVIICEAFLCVEPHFGLWLKMFCVKPKSGGADFA
jgi:hypothetical protein